MCISRSKRVHQPRHNPAATINGTTTATITTTTASAPQHHVDGSSSMSLCSSVSSLNSSLLSGISSRNNKEIKIPNNSRSIRGDGITNGGSVCVVVLEDDETIFRRSEIVTCTDVLGKGAFADVFEVNAFRPRYRGRESLRYNCASGRHNFVIKQLRQSLEQYPNDFEQAVSTLVNEAEFLSQLNHPNILRLRGVATTSASAAASVAPPALRRGSSTSSVSSVISTSSRDHFLVLDKLDETLTQRLTRWRQGATAKRTIEGHNPKMDCAYQIAMALEYLHSKNIIYRDLKPDNIGFKGDTVKLFDFGLSRELPKKNASVHDRFEMSGAGTRRYMAPEVVMAEPYNATADTYGWAMVCHQILCLQKPYAAYNRTAHYERVCERGERPRLLKYWPTQVSNLLRDAWEHDPDKRLTTKQVVERIKPLLSLSVIDTLSPSERSLQMIKDMANLFTMFPPTKKKDLFEDDTTANTQNSFSSEGS